MANALEDRFLFERAAREQLDHIMKKERKIYTEAEFRAQQDKYNDLAAKYNDLVIKYIECNNPFSAQTSV